MSVTIAEHNEYNANCSNAPEFDQYYEHVLTRPYDPCLIRVFSDSADVPVKDLGDIDVEEDKLEPADRHRRMEPCEGKISTVKKAPAQGRRSSGVSRREQTRRRETAFREVRASMREKHPGGYIVFLDADHYYVVDTYEEVEERFEELKRNGQYPYIVEMGVSIEPGGTLDEFAWAGRGL